jgi:UDP-2,3-diacylglucosamine pyrophosphatase LpxH
MTDTPDTPDRHERRRIEVLVLSDIHLGYRGCHAETLLAYLKTIEPQRVVLNGDIIDIWQFSKRFWPESHLKVLRRLLKFAQRGVPVHYVTGNHDEALRRYSPFTLGNVDLVDRLELVIDGRRHWFLHGDAFDALIATPRWLQWIGTLGYDGVSFVSSWINRIRVLFGMSRISPARYFKQNLASAARHIARFEETCAKMAAERGCDAVVCGHIHAANKRLYQVNGRDVQYLNSGDWVESCTALEYVDGQWSVVHIDHLAVDHESALSETAAVSPASLLSEAVSTASSD